MTLPVLYISLEDNAKRLQGRFSEIIGDDAGTLHFATKSKLIGGGLERQILNFIEEHPKVSLIIIDTLQKIREAGNEKNSYASDYDIISKIKAIADDNNIAFLIVHHTRKLEDDDPFNNISGTNGLLGAADGAFVLVKNSRIGNTATLYTTGRDIADIKLFLEFDRDSFIWTMRSHNDESLITADNPILCTIDNILQTVWQGTSTELLNEIAGLYPAVDLKPNVLSRTLNANSDLLLTKYNISYSQKRVNGNKQICFERILGDMYDMSDNFSTGRYSENIGNIVQTVQNVK